MYNKIFTKILDSSVWLESTPTRIVWFTFLAAMDDIGFVQFASSANVAHRARVELAEAENALACLERPDPHSSDPANEGRRIERVPGGWMVLNAEKYRDLVTRTIIREQTRQRVSSYRQRLKASKLNEKPRVTHEKRSKRDASVTDRNRALNVTRVTSSDTDTYSETDLSNTNNKLIPKVGANTTSGNGHGPAPAPNGNGDGRSKRPIFAGQRLTVFEWMLDDCMNTLGTHTEAFDLHAWFFDLDAAAVRDGLVIPKTRDGNAWLQTQLVNEAQKRNLPLKFASATPTKMTEDEAYREAARLGPMKRPHQR